MAEVLTAKGRNGQVSFDGRLLTITREGAVARASQGRSRKDYPVAQIAGVQLRPTSLMRAGYFQVTVPGGSEVKGNSPGDVASDENTVVFGKKAQPEFEAIRDAVLAAL